MKQKQSKFVDISMSNMYATLTSNLWA